MSQNKTEDMEKLDRLESEAVKLFNRLASHYGKAQTYSDAAKLGQSAAQILQAIVSLRAGKRLTRVKAGTKKPEAAGFDLES